MNQLERLQFVKLRLVSFKSQCSYMEVGKVTYVISTGDWPETTAQTTTARIPSSRFLLNSKGSILGLAGVFGGKLISSLDTIDLS